LIAVTNEKLDYFDGNLFQYQTEMQKKRKHAKRQQATLDKKREAVQKTISEGKRQAKKTGDENRQRMIKSREKKLNDRWGLEVNAAGHRFKVRLNAKPWIKVEC
jgi:ATP-binding cassette subfamily F protein 3